MSTAFKLPSLTEFISTYEKNFDSYKKTNLIPQEMSWEAYKEVLKAEYARLARMDPAQYKAHCEEAQRNYMALFRAKEKELTMLINLGKQREGIQGDLHEIRERLTFARRKKK